MMLVVVMRPPLAADVMTDTTELVLMRLVGEVRAAAAPFALLVVEVDVVADVDVDVEVGVDEVDEVDELDDDDDDDDDVDVDVVSLVVVSPLP